MKKTIGLLLFCFGAFAGAIGQVDTLVNPAAKVDSLASEKAIFKIYPLAYYTPETRIAFELFSIYSFKFKNAQRTSNIRFFATYSLNKQYLFILPWQLSTSGAKYLFDGRLDYRFFPDYFYGIGSDTKADIRELYAYDAFSFLNKGYRKIKTNVYLGAQTDFISYQTDIKMDNNLFAQSQDLYGQQSAQFGLFGPSLLLDSRDHVLCPHQGQMFEITLPFGLGRYDDNLNAFFQINIDFRYYKRISSKMIWASQLVSQNTLGKAPFLALPKMGGPFLARGYYQGRFRDNHLHAIQTELRQDLFWRIGLVAFGSIGMVENKLFNSRINQIKLAGGAGLRYKMSKNDRANVRLDFSFTHDSRGIYIFFAEAF